MSITLRRPTWADSVPAPTLSRTEAAAYRSGPEDLGEGRTRATYTLDSDPGRVLGMLIRGPIEAAIRAMLVNARPGELKGRVEST